ncbi:hypothetical protein TNCV_1253861 [Trichonephila clavipes]|nr:hypothetical protein TNCV_1253861 [Trichonephila clavipes]
MVKKVDDYTLLDRRATTQKIVNDLNYSNVTVDESWIHQYYLETKHMDQKLKYRDLPSPKKTKILKTAGQIMLSVFGKIEESFMQTTGEEPDHPVIIIPRVIISRSISVS